MKPDGFEVEKSSVQSPMRIAFVNTFFPPWRGGAETYSDNLTLHLAKRGHEVTVFCAKDPLEAGRTKVNGRRICRMQPFGRLYGVPILPALVPNLLAFRPDLLHVNFPNPYNAFAGAVASKIQRVPSVITWHNDLPAVTKSSGLLVAVNEHFLSKVYLAQFAKIIATTRVYAYSSRILSKFKGKITIIPNGVDCQRFRPGLDASRIVRRHQLAGCAVLLFVGALTKWHRYKGLDVLLSAMPRILKEFHNVKLVVVGDGHLRSEYQKIAEALGIASRIVFAGDVTDYDLPFYYSASDLVLVPSKDRSEGFGLTILEANACGKPVVGSIAGGIPDVLLDGVNGILVPPNDPGKLSETVVKILGDKRLRESLAKSCRKIAEEHDWRIVAERVDRLYRTVIE